MKNIDDKYSWNLEDLYNNQKEFYDEMSNVKENLKQIETYKGILCDSTDNLYKCYKIYEETLMKFEKIYAYG